MVANTSSYSCSKSCQSSSESAQTAPKREKTERVRKGNSICCSFTISGCPSGNLLYEELPSTFVCKVCLKRCGWRNNTNCALHSTPTTTQPTHLIDVIAVIACTST